MTVTLALRLAAISSIFALLSGCTADKLEARLQADPQCKSVVNTKTGALMPCPGTDKEFYKSIPSLNTNAPKVNQPAEVQASKVTASSSPAPASASTPKSTSAPVECKPQLHQKSGSLMPCPAP
ncbi:MULTISPECIES: hypothetical protein [unclassified Polynucleobacter]|uniref:hypothetical protein n=1 Tax=unclassified Polynucleobacter TaxID=2640945 RepID=UPI0008B13F33|nr:MULTISPECIES: hypothetical protein [unclassified Polynucleobacter]OHC08924.1 MAG: hypothetical protein A2X74_04005 [Polynucleobacter sp. GWA2_45_21]HBK43128.1 hypothetical protein [Polynucleobacter sp.]